jgi:hypothetical protein
MGKIERRKRSKFTSPKIPGAKLTKRRPDWLADESVEPLPMPIDTDTVFPEELIHKSGGRFSPFAPIGVDEAFSVVDYQRLYGHKFSPKVDDDFDDYLNDLLGHIRRYNASLYWLRLFHIKDNSSPASFNALPKIQVPGGGYRDHTDLANIPNIGHATFSVKLGLAEDDFTLRTDDLRKYIQNGFSHRINGSQEVVLDAIKVNDYVTSVRVVAGGDILAVSGEFAPRQVGGSSSSYIYISSPISSYTGG